MGLGQAVGDEVGWVMRLSRGEATWYEVISVWSGVGVNRQFEMGSRKQAQQTSWNGRDEGCHTPSEVESTPGAEARIRCRGCWQKASVNVRLQRAHAVGPGCPCLGQSW
jgi:hypothetical protein